MKILKFVQGAVVALAAVGVVFPQLPAIAATKAPVIKTVAANTVFDISLKSGTFTGRVVDHTGAALEGAEVIVKNGQKEVARTVTDKSGTFSAANLKTGAYTVASGATAGQFRVWSETTAPPSAKPQALLVMGSNNTRGQCGCCEGSGDNCCLWIAGGLGLLALAVGAVAVSINDNPSTVTVINRPASP